MTTILPVIDYCCTVYMVANQSELDKLQKLQKLQNVVRRMITNMDLSCPVYELHSKTPFPLKEKKCIVKLFWKWEHGDGPSFLCKMIEPQENVVHQTRHATSWPPIVPKIKTTMGERSIHFRATHSWITAKDDFKQCTKLAQLKSKLRMVWDTCD